MPEAMKIDRGAGGVGADRHFRAQAVEVGYE
jgi:hypothetical protein